MAMVEQHSKYHRRVTLQIFSEAWRVKSKVRRDLFMAQMLCLTGSSILALNTA
jgi:hypothetical protein